MTAQDDRPHGWYLHPDDPKQHRYWDGYAWEPFRSTTDHTHRDTTVEALHSDPMNSLLA